MIVPVTNAHGSVSAPACPVDSQGRAGPVTKDELRYLYNHHKLDASTLVWAEGMAQPCPLAHNRELRCSLSACKSSASTTHSRHEHSAVLCPCEFAAFCLVVQLGNCP